MSSDAAAVASGVVFGRAVDVSVANQQAFLESGLWPLLEGRQLVRTSGNIATVPIHRTVAAFRPSSGTSERLFLEACGSGGPHVDLDDLDDLVTESWAGGMY
jgi:hypothetical protein